MDDIFIARSPLDRLVRSLCRSLSDLGVVNRHGGPVGEVDLALALDVAEVSLLETGDSTDAFYHDVAEALDVMAGKYD